MLIETLKTTTAHCADAPGQDSCSDMRARPDAPDGSHACTSIEFKS